MMSQAVSLSIVIPTRNRNACVESLLHTLECYYVEDGHRFQVVIADNSDDNSLHHRVSASPIPIDYHYTCDTLSVVENFNRTIPHIRGEYVCFIGDDDIVSRKLFELIDLMSKNKIDAAIVSPAVKCLYFWPGVSHVRWGDVGGRLYTSTLSGRVQKLDVSQKLKQSRSRISDGPLSLPRAYFGVVSKKCIDEVTHRFGALFGGVSPDIFSSRLLADVVKTFVAVNLPFIAPGAAAASTSAARAKRSDVGKLRDNDHTGRFKELSWDRRVPDFYSPFTVWAQSYIQAEQITDGIFVRWAFPYLYAKCFVFSRGHKSSIFNAIYTNKNRYETIFQTTICILFVLFEYGLQKLPLLLHRSPGGAQNCYQNLLTSDEATQCLNEHLIDISLYYDNEKG